MNDAGSRDPYLTGQAQGRRDWPHVPLEARFVAVLKDHRDGRGMQLIRARTRAVRRYEIHEFMITDEVETALPGNEVTDVSYIACAKRMLVAEDAFYPQFATHNAHTLAAVVELSGGRRDFVWRPDGRTRFNPAVTTPESTEPNPC